MSTPTLYMGLPNPTVGGDANTWGGFLNTCFNGFDALAVRSIISVSTTSTLGVFNGPVLVKATAGAGGITLTLPDATVTTNKGRVYDVVKVDSAVGAVTLAGTSGQTFSGAATLSISAQWAGFTLTSDGLNWVVSDSGNIALAGDLGGTPFVPQVISTHLTSPLPVAQGGTASTTATGSGSVVLATSPTISGATLSGALTVSGTATFTAANPTFFSSTGSGAVVLANSPTITGTAVFPAATYTGLFNETSQDNITATGSTQGTAFATTTQTIRITSAAAGAGITLPPSAAGLELLVINHAVNAVQVYGLGSDTIDDQLAAVGVSQMANSLVIYTAASAGKWYSEGLSTGFSSSLGLATQSNQDNIVAHAGGGQALATPLTKLLNRVSVVATAGDSVLLPASTSGLVITVLNGAPAAGSPSVFPAMNVFPSGTETINGAGAGVAFSQAGNSAVIYYCVTIGSWYTK